MTHSFLIDTNIYSCAMRGDREVVQALQQMNHIAIAVISIGELLSGFKAGTKEKENRRQLHAFLDSPRVGIYNTDENTAEFYSAVLNQLKLQGTPIPTNDIWIAATAFQHGLPVYTKDAHFSHIKGLILMESFG